jgi:hypothetical protein
MGRIKKGWKLIHLQNPYTQSPTVVRRLNFVLWVSVFKDNQRIWGICVVQKELEGDNQYYLEYSREEITQTVLDDMLQEYGGNIICESIDKLKTFIIFQYIFKIFKI